MQIPEYEIENICGASMVAVTNATVEYDYTRGWAGDYMHPPEGPEVQLHPKTFYFDSATFYDEAGGSEDHDFDALTDNVKRAIYDSMEEALVDAAIEYEA